MKIRRLSATHSRPSSKATSRRTKSCRRRAIWLVGQVPQGIRQQMNLPNDTKGTDGIFLTRTGVLVPYQVKFRSQRAYLTYTQIAPFLGLTERATDRIVFTNSNELAEDVKNRDAMRRVR